MPCAAFPAFAEISVADQSLGLWQGAALCGVRYPHNFNPRPASAAALLRHEDAATSAAGTLDADSSGSDVIAE